MSLMRKGVVIVLRHGKAKVVKAAVVEREHIRERIDLRGTGSNIMFKKPGNKVRLDFTSAEPLTNLE